MAIEEGDEASSRNAGDEMTIKSLHVKHRKKRNKPVIITSPDGREFQVDSLGAWANGYGIASQGLRDVANGKRSDYRGYKARWA